MILTAEEFFDSSNMGLSNTTEYMYCQKDIVKKAIEFAKFHVEAALKAAAENAETETEHDYRGGSWDMVDKDSILNAYPLENIK